jgi:hypothetical protein
MNYREIIMHHSARQRNRAYAAWLNRAIRVMNPTSALLDLSS